jgi:hypothetical protein
MTLCVCDEGQRQPLRNRRAGHRLQVVRRSGFARLFVCVVSVINFCGSSAWAAAASNKHMACWTQATSGEAGHR